MGSKVRICLIKYSIILPKEKIHSTKSEKATKIDSRKK